MNAQTAEFPVRPVEEADRAWIARLLAGHWGSPVIVTRGRAHRADLLPGFVALVGDQPAGLLTYHVEGKACEVVSLDSLIERRGIGAALLDAVKQTAAGAGCTRLWLITTNDNTQALHYYQRRGFVLAALHRDALTVSRGLKPEIPLTGIDGIPLRDEIELEMSL